MLYCSQGKLSLNEVKDPSITRENDSYAGKVGIQNPELWNPEYSLRNPESPLTIRIQNPFPPTKIRNPVAGIRIQRPGIQSPRPLIKKRKLSLWWSFRWSLWCWSVFWPDGLKMWRDHAAYCQPNFPGGQRQGGLRPASLTHENSQRRKIIDGMSPARAQRSINQSEHGYL